MEKLRLQRESRERKDTLPNWNPRLCRNNLPNNQVLQGSQGKGLSSCSPLTYRTNLRSAYRWPAVLLGLWAAQQVKLYRGENGPFPSGHSSSKKLLWSQITQELTPAAECTPYNLAQDLWPNCLNGPGHTLWQGCPPRRTWKRKRCHGYLQQRKRATWRNGSNS